MLRQSQKGTEDNARWKGQPEVGSCFQCGGHVHLLNHTEQTREVQLKKMTHIPLDGQVECQPTCYSRVHLGFPFRSSK